MYSLNIWKISRKLAGLTVFITGASRGIGKEIGKKVAQDGANVVIAAKTAEPHPKLKGTVYTAAEESLYFYLNFQVFELSVGKGFWF